MGLVASSTGTFKSVAPGTYPARCIKLIDLGTQESDYNGKVNVAHKVLVVWELPTELIIDGAYAGQPYAVAKFYTLSLNEKANLRKDLETWRGKAFTKEEEKGFDIRNILGAPCMVSIIHSETGKTKVNGVMALPKGMTVPTQINPSVVFVIDEWDEDVFDSLSDGIKDIIKKSEEYRFKGEATIDRSNEYDEHNPPFDDSDIPF
jgi:hypothetical protein